MSSGAPPAADDPSLRARLDAVCAEGQAIFERFDRQVRERAFHPFVAADYEVVRAALLGLRASGTQRFLEWGSATGIITIMADLMGFEACGIEIDGSLVETARAVAASHGSAARFVVGSFLPTGYVHRTPDGDARTGTLAEGPSGYLALGRALEDFDVVFGYPWGGEEPVMLDVMQRYGSPKAVLLLFDASGEIRAYRGGRERVTLA
jgi:predicted O-methyltransferase YrrM